YALLRRYCGGTRTPWLFLLCRQRRAACLVGRCPYLIIEKEFFNEWDCLSGNTRRLERPPPPHRSGGVTRPPSVCWAAMSPYSRERHGCTGLSGRPYPW